MKGIQAAPDPLQNEVTNLEACVKLTTVCTLGAGNQAALDPLHRFLVSGVEKGQMEGLP